LFVPEVGRLLDTIPGLVDIVSDYCGDDHDGTVFGSLIRCLVPDPFYGFGWTLHGAIKWEIWASYFVEWCKRNAQDLQSLPNMTQMTRHQLRAWYPALVLFFTQHSGYHHYGSYEAQILLHSHLSYSSWRSPESFLQDLESIAKKMDAITRKHLPLLRYLYGAKVFPIITGGGTSISLRYHGIVPEAKQEMEQVAKLVAS
jgi:hypothetical protein